MSQTPGWLAFVWFVTCTFGAMSGARAQDCKAATGNEERLKCELYAKAGPEGKRLAYERVLRGEEPNSACTETTTYKKVACATDRAGNTRCSLAVEENYNCGAEGESTNIFSCVKLAGSGELHCSQDIESNDGEALDDAQIDRALAADPFAAKDQLRPRYRAHVGSSQTELGAYKIGYEVREKVKNGFPAEGETEIEVERAVLASGTWFRAWFGGPTSREEATALCGKLKRAGAEYCAAMQTSWVKSR